MAIRNALNIATNVEFIDMPDAIRFRYQYLAKADMRKLREAGFNTPFHTLEAGVSDYVTSLLTQPDPYR